MADIKASVVDSPELSTSEKEASVLENAGVKVTEENGIYKVNLNKLKQDAVQEQSTDASVLRTEESEVGLQEVGEGDKEPKIAPKEKEEIIELITDNDEKELLLQPQQEADETASIESQEADDVREEKIVLPENVQKLVDFMNETGGTLEDYVRLSADYSNADENTLLKEYYKQTKSHLDSEEINFLLEDKFSFDEDIDDERDIKRKKLAFKEEVKKAKDFLTTLKDKYYAEVKLGSRLAPEQQKAIDFFNRYNTEQSEQTARQQKASEHFLKQTEQVFNQDFKGFDFKVGDNKYRFKVNDVQQTKQAQSDIMNTFKTFLDANNMLQDAQGYHKALFVARNADSIANHFYEQGKADALKQLEAESKNINMDPRKTSDGIVNVGGLKVRAITGDDSSKLRVKIKQ